MNILIIGGNGMLGKVIVSEFLKSSKNILYPTSSEMNLYNKENITNYFNENSIDYIIHCAGFTNVNEAENNINAYKINCESMYWLVNECRNRSIPLLYFSTDYVFDGIKKIPYKEEDKKNPLNTYGMTKAISEDIITSNLSDYRIIRLSWLFGESQKCFPEKIISKLKEGNEFHVVCDQIGSPTYVKDISATIRDLINLPTGIYHLSNSGHTSWYDFAILIADYLNLEKSLLKKSYSNTFDCIVKRPVNSILDNTKIAKYDIKLKSYVMSVKEYLSKYKI